MTSVSVVIRCFNEEPHIGRLLTGLAKQTLQPQQIVVVDSGSTDATLSIASQFGVEIHTIRPEDFSFGRSLNIGCAAATGELIVMASAHVYPLYDSWIAELAEPLSDHAVAVAYGRQEGDARTKYSEAQILARWFPAQSEARQAHPFCNNANAAIRRSVWEDQPYDEELTGLEDVDWARRAQQRGLAIAYVAEAPVVHVHEENWSEVVNRHRREALAQRRIYADQHMGWFDAIRLASANIASDYIHAARDGQLLSNLRSIPIFRAAQFLGTYRGFSQRGAVSPVLKRRFYYPHGLGSQPRPPEPHRGTLINYDEPPAHGADAAVD